MLLLPLSLALTLASGVSPALARWATTHERRILADGVPLSVDAQDFARDLEIVEPEGIRVLEIDPIPLPAPTAVINLAIRWGFPIFRPGGMCLGRGIYLLPGQAQSLQHELVHTLQYQRLGGAEKFMHRYLMECLVHGYRAAPLEIEADNRSR